MIKQIVNNGETLINIPANKQSLIELGLSQAEAQRAMDEHNAEQQLKAVRAARAPLLVEADHLVNIALDNGVDIAPFRQYRQALRDITKTHKTLAGVVWPQKPLLPQS